MRYFKIEKTDKQYEESYIIESQKRHLSVFFPVSVGVFVMQLALILYQYIRFGDRLFSIMYFNIYASTAIVFLTFSVVLYLYKTKKLKKHRYLVDFIFVICSYSLVLATAYLEFYTGANESVIFIALSIFTGCVLQFKLWHTWILLFASNIAYIFLHLTTVEDHSDSSTAVLNCLFVLVATILISIPLYNERVKRFNQEIEIAKNNEILKNTNAALEYFNKKLEETATTDSLTGVYNRLAFDTMFKSIWEVTKSSSKPLCLIIIDTDYFKKYNDSFGHVKGDECLKAIAGSISKSLKRPGDHVFRYGGEEFVVLLPDAHIDGAKIVTNRILRNIKQLKIPQSEPGQIVTASAGLHCVVPNDTLECLDLLRSADKALYHAKNSGRDRLAIFDELPN